MDSLFNACRQRQDETGKRLLECEGEIRNGNVTLRYHSPTHIKRYIEKQALSSPIAGLSSKDPCEESEVQTPRLTRQTLSTLKFDWKQYCFICGKTCSSKNKSEWANVVSSIDSEGDTKVFKAAQARRDDAMLVRLGEVPNGDLVATEARYHRSKCYTSYINPRNIATIQVQSKMDSQHDKALKIIIDEITPDINDKKVFQLSSVTSSFQELLSQVGVELEDVQRYTSQKLKAKLSSNCPYLCFIPQPGYSDLVCSCDITVGTALRKANELVTVLREVSDVTDQSQPETHTQMRTDETLLHQAAGILRRGILHTTKLDNEYYSFEEMLKAEKDFNDPLLDKFILWLTCEEFFYVWV